MNPVDLIPHEVLRFIDDHVESIEQLEILRLLGEAGATPWNVADLTQASQTRPDAIQAHLARLEAHGLLKTETHENAVLCRLAPTSAALAERVQELLRAYKEHPVTLIRWVYSRKDDRLKAFAEAFRLRQEKG